MRQRGFTLIEMVVTMGIIVVLMGILIPTVKGIQAEARSASCMNNLRQLFTATDTYRVANKDLLPMCEFIPVATAEGPQGGLPEVLKGHLKKDAETWRCPADFDEEGSLSTGTSYLYVPGLIRYTPQIQYAVQQSMIPYLMDIGMSQAMKDKLRTEAEAKLTTRFYESNADAFAVIADSQDRHKYGDRVPKNGVYLDGSARILESQAVTAED